MTSKKSLAVFLSLFLLVGGASAWEFTATVDTNFDDFYEDAWGLKEDDSIVDTLACNAMTAWAVPECTQPFNLEIGGSTVSELKWSIANAGSLATENREDITGSITTRLNASYGTAIAESKAQAIMDLNEGYSEAVAVSNASDGVREWYAEIQRNALNQRNKEVLKVNNSWTEAQKAGADSLWFKGTKNAHITGLRVHTKNVTLYDGQNMTGYFIEAKVPYEKCSDTSTGYTWRNLTSQETVSLEYWGSDCQTENVETDLYAEDPEGKPILFHSPDDYLNTETEITAKKDQAISNVRTIVEDIYGTYAVGELNVSESLGPLETLKVASTSYESTGYFDYATVTAEQMGLNTNDTYAFTVGWNNTGEDLTYQDTGQLFIADNSYNGTIEVGKEYNATDRTVWLTRTDSSGDIVQEQLNGTFTVTDMVNKESGESVSKTSVQEIKVYDKNISDLKDQFEELREALQEAEHQEASGTAGGTSGPTGLFGMNPATTGAITFFGMLGLIAGGVLLLL